MESSGSAVPELTTYIAKSWSQMLKTQKQASEFLGLSKTKQIGKLSAFFNSRLDINRFFVEDSDSVDRGEPKVEFGSGATNDLDFEDALEDALCVFKSGGVDSDILEQNEKQILCYLDLDNEGIVDKVTASKQRSADSSEGAESSKLHPVLFNQYPICKDHSLVLLFAEEGLPQVLSDELLLLMIQVFKVSNKPELRIGYNSMGADCIINNLHFHLLSCDNLYPSAKSESQLQFPIEGADKKLFFRSNLKHRDAEEINMYNCGVRFGEVLNFPLRALLISPDIVSDDTSLEDAQEALAHACGVVINHMIDQNIPHNVLITDEGMTVYVIPRKFDMMIENVGFFTSFESVCGFVKFKTQQSYDNTDEASLLKQMKEQVSLDIGEFNKLKEQLISKFMKEYECDVSEQVTKELSQLKI